MTTFWFRGRSMYRRDWPSVSPSHVHHMVNRLCTHVMDTWCTRGGRVVVTGSSWPRDHLINLCGRVVKMTSLPPRVHVTVTVKWVILCVPDHLTPIRMWLSRLCVWLSRVYLTISCTVNISVTATYKFQVGIWYKMGWYGQDTRVMVTVTWSRGGNGVTLTWQWPCD